MRLAADANVLLSAVIGGAARTVLAHPAVDAVLSTENVLGEIRAYAPVLARRRGLSPYKVELAVAALPVTVVPEEKYGDCVPEAERRIGSSDPDDVALLALALRFNIPIWSNDNDFSQAGVEWLTTAQLLRTLEDL